MPRHFITIALFFVLSAISLHAANAPIAFTSPRGGELYVIGQTQKVVVTSKFKIVVVELSRDGGANFIALGTIDNRAIVDKSKLNQLPWNVIGPASNRAQIRVTGKISLTDNRKDVTITSGDFSITESVTGLPDGSVTTATLADKSVTVAKINSENASNGFLLFADGLGGATWNAPPFVKIAGDTMTGPLLLSGEPTQGLQAATKNYVDAESTRATGSEETLTTSLANEVSRATSVETTITTDLNAEIVRATAAETTLANIKVSKAGDVMTGPLTLSGDPTVVLHAATKGYVDAASARIQASEKYPDGITGTSKALTIDSTGYTVPNGKTLYLMTCLDPSAPNISTLSVDGKDYFFNDTKVTVFPTPVIIPGGAKVLCATATKNVTGLELPASVTAKAFVIDSTGYSVPNGKTLYILTCVNPTSGPADQSLSIDGADYFFIRSGTVGISPLMAFFDSPLIVPGGSTIRSTSELNVTGYER